MTSYPGQRYLLDISSKQLVEAEILFVGINDNQKSSALCIMLGIDMHANKKICFWWCIVNDDRMEYVYRHMIFVQCIAMM